MARGARFLLLLAFLAALLAVLLQLYRLRKPVCPLLLTPWCFTEFSLNKKCAAGLFVVQVSLFM
jgi:hypothetical protein